MGGCWSAQVLMPEHTPGEEIRTKHKELIHQFITDLTFCPRTSLSPTMWANRQLIRFAIDDTPE
jgi:hypothetical protein